MDWASIASDVAAGVILMALGGAGTAFGVMRYKGIKILNVLNALSHLPDELQTIKKQLFPNGGSSLFDQVKRIGVDAKVSIAQNDAIFEQQDIAAFRSDPQGRCLYVSDRWCKFAQMDRAEAMDYGGFGWNNSIKDSWRPKIIPQWADSLEKGIPFEAVFRFRSGRKVRAVAKPVYQDGKVVEWVGTTIEANDQSVTGDEPR